MICAKLASSVLESVQVCIVCVPVAAIFGSDEVEKLLVLLVAQAGRVEADISRDKQIEPLIFHGGGQ